MLQMYMQFLVLAITLIVIVKRRWLHILLTYHCVSLFLVSRPN